MSTDELEAPAKPRPRAALLLLSAGAALIVASFIWPSLSNGRESWTTEHALEHQHASADLHQLSHKYDQERAKGNGEAVLDELEQARAEYGKLDADLEAARNRPARVAMVLRVLGVLLAIGGGISYVKATRS